MVPKIDYLFYFKYFHKITKSQTPSGIGSLNELPVKKINN